MTKKTSPNIDTDLTRQVLEYFEMFRMPLKLDELGGALAHAERDKISYLAFLQRLMSEPAGLKKQRGIERRVHAADFAEHKTLETFDWNFNPSIDRAQFEQLATADFIRRADNIALVGHAGVGKSHLMQAIGLRACALGYHVRYIKSAELITELNASRADHTLSQSVRAFSKPDLLIIDEFGFDRIEREDCKHAVNLLYKVIDARSTKRSTAIITNVDFKDWANYLDDPPLAMAFLDRIVAGAIVVKIKGPTYRPLAKGHTSS